MVVRVCERLLLPYSSDPNCLPCLVLVLANVGGILDQKQAGVVAWLPLVCCAGAAAWLWDLHVNACLRDG